jgi:ribose transport system substrate-binding protein
MHRGIVGRAAVGASALVLGIGGLAACGDDGDNSSGSKGQSTIGWVPPTVSPFEKAMREGIEQQAKALGMELTVAGGEFDPKVQISAVDSLVQRDVDAIMIWPLDEQGIQPAFDRARESDIPIITIDSPNARANVNFQTDDVDATRALAKVVADKVGNPCAVGIIQGPPIVPIIKARAEGYTQGARESGCEILDIQTNREDTPEGASKIAAGWRTRFGSEMNGILSNNDPQALAALAQTGGDFKPEIVGLNGDAPNIEAIREGRLLGTAALLSPEIGNGMAYVAKELLDGKTVPSTIAANYAIVTNENVGEYKSYEERTAAPMKVSIRGSGNDGVLEAQIAK